MIGNKVVVVVFPFVPVIAITFPSDSGKQIPIHQLFQCLLILLE
jgi:hypothetical protein